MEVGQHGEQCLAFNLEVDETVVARVARRNRRLRLLSLHRLCFRCLPDHEQSLVEHGLWCIVGIFIDAMDEAKEQWKS